VQADFERQADPNDPQQQALLEEMRIQLKKVPYTSMLSACDTREKG
jgi:hypothetical protein